MLITSEVPHPNHYTRGFLLHNELYKSTFYLLTHLLSHSENFRSVPGSSIVFSSTQTMKDSMMKYTMATFFLL